MTTPTPRLDAIARWIAAGRVGDIDWPQTRQPDPLEWSDPNVRARALLAMSASGAPAELPPRSIVIRGRRIPIPPGGPSPYRHGPRHRPPKARRNAQKASTP